MATQRVKDAGFLQQHIEKLVLGAGLLILLIAFMIYFVGNPFAIELGGRSYDSAGPAISALKQNDEKIKRGLSDPSPIPDVELPPFAGNVMAMLNLKPDLTRSIARINEQGLSKRSIDPIVHEAVNYAAVYPPVPENIQFVSGADVLDANFTPEIVKAYHDLWGGEPESEDFTMFIASGDFKIADWIKRLRAPATNPEQVSIPPGIWVARFGVAGVVLLREEWDPERGAWGNRVMVPALPGQQRLLPTDEAPTETTDALTLIQALRERQAELARPELPWLDGFVQAVAPGGDLIGAEAGFGIIADEDLGPAEQQIKQLQLKIDQLEQTRKRIEERRRPRPGPAGAGADDFGDADTAAPSGNDRIMRQIDSLKQKITILQPRADKEADERRRRTEIRERREQERIQRESLLGQARPGIDGGDLIDRFKGLDLSEGASMRVWTADPTMKPGMTYRYKLMVAVINPLYAVPRLDPEQLAENRSKAAILPSEEEIEEMPWIGPVKVEPRIRFFFTSANNNQAKVEVFRFINGVQHKQVFSPEPGDSIGGKIVIKDKLGFEPDKTIDMNVGSVLVDVEYRKDKYGNTSIAMMYMDESGEIYERIQSDDSSDPQRKVLERILKEGPEWPLRPKFDEPQPGFGGDDGGFEEL